jgi:HNH endonuclease
VSYIAQDVQDRVREAARHRCGYCQAQQRYVLGRLEIEHIIPTAKGGTDEEENLWLACRLCNNYKGTQIQGLDPISENLVDLFNPRYQIWNEHFDWNENGVQVIGLTPAGRATVIALQLNDPLAVEVRRNWVAVGWHPPKN